MRQINDQVDDAPTDPDGVFTAVEFNQGLKNEVQNPIPGTGQTFDAADQNQLGKAIAAYSSSSDFYVAGGIPNAITLSPVGLKQSPPSYADGMRVRFVAIDTNTGATTLNVNGLGVKNIFSNGAALPANTIISGNTVEVVYSLSSDRFNIVGGGAGITLLQEVSPTAVNSFQVTGLPSTATRIIVTVDGIDFATATRMQIRLLDSGTPITTGYDGSTVYFPTATPSIAANDSNIEFTRQNNVVGTSVHDGRIELTRVGTSEIFIANTLARLSERASAIDTNWASNVTRTPVPVGTIDGLEFFSLSGANFTAGTVAVYYE